MSDFDRMFEELLDSWETLWNEDISLFQNVKNLIKQSVFLPEEILLELATIYLLSSSKLPQVLPIMFSYGDKGTGKSTLSILANLLRGIESTFSPADTFASIRNSLEQMRWGKSNSSDEESEESIYDLEEQEGVLLAWDNIHSKTLMMNLPIYQMLLCGYNRKTDRIQIAGSKGTNNHYRVFCPKIISSIEALHLEPDLSELQRRLLVIPHKKFEKFSTLERAMYEEFDEPLDLTSINWKGLEKKYFNFWEEPGNQRSFLIWRSNLMKARRNKEAAKLSQDRWIISLDLMAVGLTLNCFRSCHQAIAFFVDYWCYIDAIFNDDKQAIIAHIQQFIHDECGDTIELNRKLAEQKAKTYEVIFSAQKFRSHLLKLSSEGALNISPKVETINKIMWEMGWKLTRNGWTQRS